MTLAEAIVRDDERTGERHLVPEVVAYRNEVRATLDMLGERSEDPLRAHRMLGDRGLLAPAWPSAFGGRDLPRIAEALLLEELGLRGLPDTLWVTSVQVTGSAILASGGAALRAELLPEIAAGRLLASALFSEHGAGSDVAAIVTTGRRTPSGGWTLTGLKTWSIGTPLAHVALCAFKDADEHGSAYDAFSLCIVDLRAEGVTIRAIPTWQPDTFHEIVLDDVDVPERMVLGTGAQAWSSMLSSIAVERSGFDYLARAQRWSRLSALEASSSAGEVLALRIRGCRLLAIHEAVHGAYGADAGALMKLAASDLAQEVDALIARQAMSRDREWDGQRRHAFREAPGLSLSAGASEVLVDVAASTIADARVRCGSCHEVEHGLEEIVLELATGLEHTALEETLRSAGLLTPAVPDSLGGLGLDPWSALALPRALGRSVQPLQAIALSDAPPETPLDAWRAVWLAGYLEGLGRTAWEAMREHAQQRIVGGRPLVERQLVADRLVRSLADLRILHELVEDCVWRRGCTYAAALASLAYEIASRVAASLIQVQGARGLTALSPAGTIRDLIQEAWVAHR